MVIRTDIGLPVLGKNEDAADSLASIFLLEDGGDEFRVADISADKLVARVLFYGSEVGRIACVGEQVQIDDGRSRGL